MIVCAEYRMAHSEFLSWGKDDRDKAIWWELRKRQTCQCGTRPDEWDPESGGRRDAYRAEWVRCAGCAMKEAREEAGNPLDEGSEQKARGFTVQLRPNRR